MGHLHTDMTVRGNIAAKELKNVLIDLDFGQGEVRRALPPQEAFFLRL